MPARLDLSAEEMLARVRAKNRERQARYRARNATVTPRNVTAYKGEAAADVTPPTPARHAVPPKTPPPPKGGPPSVRAAPKPNKSGAVIDLLKAAGVPEALSEADHRHIKTSRLSPAQIAEAYAAAFNGEWGGDWLQEHLNVANVLSRYAGFLAWKQRPAAPPRRTGATNGVVHQPNSLKHNRQPDAPRLLEGDLTPIERDDFSRYVAERRRLPLEQRVAQWRGGGK